MIAPLEGELGIPVLTANQVTMWAGAAPSAVARRVGPGRSLLREPGVAWPRAGHVFTDAGASARWRGCGTVMAERSLAALVVADPANLYYLTGYNAWSFYTPQCLVVPAAASPTCSRGRWTPQGGHTRPTSTRTTSTAIRNTWCTARTCTPSTGSRTAPGARPDRRASGVASASRRTRTSSPRADSWPCAAASDVRPWWTRRSWSTGCG